MSEQHEQKTSRLLHIIALAATLSLIFLISYATISNATSLHHSHIYLRLQLGLCMILLADMATIFIIRQKANIFVNSFRVYIALLFAVVYFSSLIFYAEERTVNPDVHTYADAIWWAGMCMTTAGSYIGEYTLSGKVMAVILSGGGLILFPVFTVYITRAVTHRDDGD